MNPCQTSLLDCCEPGDNDHDIGAREQRRKRLAGGDAIFASPRFHRRSADRVGKKKVSRTDPESFFAQGLGEDFSDLSLSYDQGKSGGAYRGSGRILRRAAAMPH